MPENRVHPKSARPRRSAKRIVVIALGIAFALGVTGVASVVADHAAPTKAVAGGDINWGR